VNGELKPLTGRPYKAVRAPHKRLLSKRDVSKVSRPDSSRPTPVGRDDHHSLYRAD